MTHLATSSTTEERLRELERSGRHQAELRALILSVTRSLSSTLNLPASLARLCHDAAPLFGARRATAWMHDRRARELLLEASSDGSVADPIPVPPLADAGPLAAALRRETPAFVTIDGVRGLAVPLRGRRRALGVLLFERLGPLPVPEEPLLERALELGRLVSSVLENTILFEEVLRSRRELENTFHSVADLVIVCDHARRVVNGNRAFRERLAARGLNPIDRPIDELVGPALAGWIRGIRFEQGAAGDSLDAIEDEALGGHFSVRATPLTSPGSAGIVIVARDRTQQVRLEAERAALDERLAQSEKLAALGQFVAGVAHELNNPLQGVLGHLELLRRTASLPRGILSELRVVYREAERAARIVNDLLVFAGSRRGARRSVSLNAIVSRTVTLRARIAQRSGITIERSLSPEPPRVRGDAQLLQQAILNVLVNAEHAIAGAGAGRGRIILSTRIDRRRARIVLDIRDSGPGIPEAVLPRIFEPFFTTKEVGKGTGLGLALAYGIVQDHGGEISARNHPRGGALFRITLPADTMDSRRAAGARARASR